MTAKTKPKSKPKPKLHDLLHCIHRLFIGGVIGYLSIHTVSLCRNTLCGVVYTRTALFFLLYLYCLILWKVKRESSGMIGRTRRGEKGEGQTGSWEKEKVGGRYSKREEAKELRHKERDRGGRETEERKRMGWWEERERVWEIRTKQRGRERERVEGDWNNRLQTCLLLYWIIYFET